MKRIFIAVGLLAAVAGLCVLCRMTLNRQTDTLLRELDGVQQALEADDSALAVARAEAFAEEIEEHIRSFPLFLRHSELVFLEDAAAQLPALPVADMPAAVARIQWQLKHLVDMERLTLENLI